MRIDSDRMIAAIAAEQHGVFTLDQAKACGLTRNEIARRIAAGRWIHHYERAYSIAGAPLSWRGRLLAACCAGGTRAVASHRSAAALWGLAGGRRDILEITCPRWRRARHGGLIVHEATMLPTCDLTTIDSIPP